MVLFYIALVLLIVALFAIAAKHFCVQWQQYRFLKGPFPRSWTRILERNVPTAVKLPPELRRNFRLHVKRFLMEKVFEPCGGILKISDDVAVTIAGNASLLVCGSKNLHAWKELQSVLIYPSTFKGRSATRVGNVITRTRENNDGESWGVERVVLSRERIRRDVALWGNAQNVIIHEFAHQFDATVFARASWELRKRWTEVAETEMARIKSGDATTIIDEYGANDPVEFFAVATEAFFETPDNLRRAHPKTYSLLEEIYAISPANW